MSDFIVIPGLTRYLFQINIMARIGSYSVYFMSNFARTVFYIGVTNNLERRVREHRYEDGSVFTSKYKCHFLVYYEDYSNIENAITREKQLKNW